MADYCAICGCDSFECGGGVTGVCIRADGGPYCARVTADGSACGEPAATCEQLRAESAEAELAVLRRRGTPSGHVVALEAALQSAEATIAAVEKKLGDLENMHQMNSRDAGQVYCASSVDDTVSELRDILRARKGGAGG